MGIHTALDTNGYLGDRLSDEELDTIDLVLLDIKTWDPERHRTLTGVDREPTLAFARRLAAGNRPIWLRFVLVPGYTDDPDDISHIASFCSGLGNVRRVDVLPFHQMGRYKWEKLKLTYQLGQVEAPPPGVVDRTIGIFRAAGLTAY
jgi:pyruvate formate lyase activating enzyme